MSSLITLIVIAALVFLWLDNRRTHEFAIGYAGHLCRTHDLQLLDQTVALSGIGLRRNAEGRVNLSRSYRFDYTRDGVNREKGYITMLGRQVEVINLENVEY